MFFFFNKNSLVLINLYFDPFSFQRGNTFQNLSEVNKSCLLVLNRYYRSHQEKRCIRPCLKFNCGWKMIVESQMWRIFHNITECPSVYTIIQLIFGSTSTHLLNNNNQCKFFHSINFNINCSTFVLSIQPAMPYFWKTVPILQYNKRPPYRKVLPRSLCTIELRQLGSIRT